MLIKEGMLLFLAALMFPSVLAGSTNKVFYDGNIIYVACVNNFFCVTNKFSNIFSEH